MISATGNLFICLWKAGKNLIEGMPAMGYYCAYRSATEQDRRTATAS
jgi:hypothetical protein